MTGSLQYVWRVWAVSSAVVLVSSCPGFAGSRGDEIHRGKYLRTDMVKTDHKDAFECELAPSSDSLLRFKMTRIDVLEIREVPVYEALVRIGGETADVTEVQYQVVPGKTVRGKMTTRTERRAVGPLSDSEFTVNDEVSIHTDHDGVAVDSEQGLLAAFDSLGASTGEFKISHGSLGDVVLKVSRRIVGQVDPEPGASVVKMTKTDILASMGYNYEPVRISMRDGLSMQVAAPDKVRRGAVLILTLTATNEGERSVSNLLLRTFSRHSWVNGKNLYAGSIAPGCRTEFRRLLKVPLDAQLGDCFLSVGVWDILGAIPGDAMRIRFKVLESAGGGNSVNGGL